METPMIPFTTRPSAPTLLPVVLALLLVASCGERESDGTAGATTASKPGTTPDQATTGEAQAVPAGPPCPVEPVALDFVETRSWSFAGGGPVEAALYRTTLTFEGCEHGPANELVLRGTGTRPEKALAIAVAASGAGAELETLATASLDAASWLDATHWALPVPLEYPRSPDRDWYAVIEQAGGTGFEAVSLEPEFGCPCSGYDRRLDRTLDYERMDLRFDPNADPPIVTEPPGPLTDTAFDIRWRCFYDQAGRFDSRSPSGDFRAVVVILGAEGELDRLEIPVESVDLSGYRLCNVPYPSGLPAGHYTIEVSLDTGDGPHVIECGVEDARANNTASCEIEVSECECPPNLGDLSITDLLAPAQVPSGTPLEVSWKTSYLGMCGSHTGESGRVVEQLKIAAIDGTRAQQTTYDQIPTIALGSSVDRYESVPLRMPPGQYRVTVRVDPVGKVEECVHAPKKNQRATAFFEVIAAEGEESGEEQEK